MDKYSWNENNDSHLCLWILEGNSCSYCECTSICCFVYLIRAGLLSQRRSALTAAPLWGEPLCQQMVKLAEGKALCSPYWLPDIKACSMGTEYIQLKHHTLKQHVQGHKYACVITLAAQRRESSSALWQFILMLLGLPDQPITSN